MKGSIKRLIAFGSIALVALVAVVSAAGAVGSYSTGLEPSTFTTGSVNGQDGWHSLSVPPHLTQGYDQEVLNNDTYGGQSGPATFGAQSLRVSNWVTEATGEFEGQTYSPSVANPAGEATGNKVFEGTFEYIPTKATFQPGLQISVSPDDGHGGRMSFVSLTDVQDGVNGDGIWIRFFDPVNGYHTVGTYDRTVKHTIKFLIEFVPGQSNDVLRLIVDGVDIGDRDDICFTTWEAFYSPDALPVTDSFEFRADNSVNAGGAPDCDLNGATMIPGGNSCVVESLDPSTGPHGYLFDNVETITRDTGGPAPCGAFVPVGVIAPTATTCQQYRDNATTPVPVLDQLVYNTKGSGVNAKINAVSPGVFFYYTKIADADAAAGDKVDITQENDATTAPAIPITQGQVVLYDAGTCKVVKAWTPTVSSNGTATGTLPTEGSFIIGVKYNPSALKGAAVPVPTTVEYTFGAELNDVAFDEATIDLVPKA